MHVVNGFTGILFQMQPFNTDFAFAVFGFDFHVSFADNRVEQLCNLIPGRQITVEIVFPVKHGMFIDFSI